MAKIVFIGGRDRGLECLQALVEAGEDISHIYCLKEDEHELEKFSPEIEKLAGEAGISIMITKSVKAEDKVKKIREINPDLIVVMGWRTIIPKEVLEIPRFGVVAAHESLLPKYRGFAPINWAIINGEEKTGVTLFFLDEGMDSGDIIAQKVISIGIADTAAEVYQKTKVASIALLMKNLEALKTGRVPRRKQDESQATYACARTPEDGLISWGDTSIKIHNLVRALSYPYPGASTTYQGKKLAVQRTSLVKSPRMYVGSVPGRIVGIEKDSVEVLTGDGLLQVDEIQLEGEERVGASRLLTSVKATLGRQ